MAQGHTMRVTGHSDSQLDSCKQSEMLPNEQQANLQTGFDETIWNREYIRENHELHIHHALGKRDGEDVAAVQEGCLLCRESACLGVWEVLGAGQVQCGC